MLRKPRAAVHSSQSPALEESNSPARQHPTPAEPKPSVTPSIADIGEAARLPILWEAAP